MINFLNEGDKLPKSRNQIIWIKQLNLGDSKLDSLISPINSGDFLQWRGFHIDKMNSQKRKRKKSFHNISLQVQKMIEMLHMQYSSFKEFIREQATCGPRLIFKIKKTFLSLSFKLWSRWMIQMEIFFCKRILPQKIYPHD